MLLSSILARKNTNAVVEVLGAHASSWFGCPSDKNPDTYEEV
jgi:hypothetical protein